MKKLISFLSGIAITCLLACSKSESPQTPDPVTPSPPVTYDWEFENDPVWADEFDSGSLPDPDKWSYEVGGNGWGNSELEYYTNSGNAFVENGSLKIVAKKEYYLGNNYTSARLITRNKGDWLYGRMEIRAKIPAGKGTWPAIWMLPTDPAYGGWPSSGELDIMEHVGFDPNRIYFTIHTEAYNHVLGTQKGSNQVVPTAIDSFHVYRADWTPYGIRGYIDGQQIFEFSNNHTGYKTWPFDKSFFLILNIAVGGSWGGAQGIDDSVFPATLEIDYARVYKFLK